MEDHPLDYGDFEGTIPKGQYGGGTVMLWDRGYWAPEGDPEKMLKKGDLKFSLDGDKLQGSWVLVRMRNDKFKSKHTNWLLIKHRDDYSKDGSGKRFWKRMPLSPLAARWARLKKASAPNPSPSCAPRCSRRMRCGRARARAATRWATSAVCGTIPAAMERLRL